jgi:inhibitor of KinA sporulation pathway (predicted exonuclease)
MVDVETTGTTSFDHTAMIQLAAVKFNFETEDVSMDFFNQSLAIPPNRFWDKGTEAWWKRQKPHILQNIQASAQPPEQVMRAFHVWLLKDYPHTDDGLRFWGKPTHFDFSFVASYFNQYELSNPCHYRSARDLNSFMSGLSGSPDTLGMENQVEFHGDEHNALDDTLHQIKMLFAAKQRYQSVEIIHAAR